MMGQCQAIALSTGVRCKRAAIKNESFCSLHLKDTKPSDLHKSKETKDTCLESDIGIRPSNEDTELIYHGQVKKTKKSLQVIAVFDGHNGKYVSHWLLKNIVSYISKQLQTNHNSPDWVKMIHQIDTDLYHHFRSLQLDSIDVGSTGIIFIRYNNEHSWLINVGDSRGVIFNKLTSKILYQTKDHKPTNKEEKLHIQSVPGGFVKNGRVLGNGLSLSRTFGDFSYKMIGNNTYSPSKGMVRVTPDVISINHLPDKDCYLLLGCDGIFDVLSSKKAIQLLGKTNPESNCHALLQHALKAPQQQDNCSIIVVKL